MRRFLNFILITFPLLWLGFTGFQYFSSYPTKISNTWNFGNYEYVFAGLVINWLIYKINFPKKTNLQLNGTKIFISIVLNILAAFIISGLRQNLLPVNQILVGSFNLIWKSVYMIVSTLLVSMAVYTLGDLFLNKFFKNKNTLKYYLYASAAGVTTTVYIMFGLGMVDQLRQIPVGLLIGLPIVLNYKASFNFLKNITTKNVIANFRFDSSFTWIYNLYLFVIAYTLTGLLKPFPVGWDSGAVYINISNLLYQNSHLISGFEAYNWSIFTSIGLIVFNNMPTTFMLSLMGGIWSMLTVFDITRRFASTKLAILCAFIVFTLPSIHFLSFVDPKVDLGFLFFGLICISLMLDFIKFKNKFKYILLSGLFAGFALGIKYTSVFLIIGLGSIIVYNGFGIAGALLVLALGLIPLFSFSIFDFRAFEVSSALKTIIIWTSAFTAMLSFIFILARRFSITEWSNLSRYSITFLLFVVFAFLPWLGFNYSTTRSFGINSLFYGKFNSPVLDTGLINNSLPVTQPIFQPEQKEDTGLKEDLGRYVGYERDSLKFFTLFYDINLGTNIKGPIVDISFLILGLLPLTSLILLYRRTQRISILIGGSVLLTIYAGICFAGANGWLTKLGFDIWTDAAIAVLSVFAINLLLTLPTFVYYSDKRIKAFTIFIFATLVVWTLLGSGIYWYSITTFALLFVLIFININELNKDKEYAIAGESLYTLFQYFIATWIAINFIAGFYIRSSEYPMESPFLRYIKDGLNVSETVYYLNSAFSDGIQPINEDEEAKVYRVGSFLYYFINDNYKRVVQDNQLDIFNEINLTPENKALVATAFKEQGFKYIIYDLNTASIDRTTEQTLVKKAEKFESFLRDNPKLELISTDRIYQGEDRQASREVFGDPNRLARRGSVAVYKITD